MYMYTLIKKATLMCHREQIVSAALCIGNEFRIRANCKLPLLQ